MVFPAAAADLSREGNIRNQCNVCLSKITSGFGFWLLAKDSEVRGKPLQLGRTYHRRTLRKTKTAWKATGHHPGKYVRLSMQPHHSAV